MINIRSLISKSISDGTDRTYAISITESSLTFNYHPNTLISGYSTLSITDSVDLSSDYWHHIAITVYQNDFAFYINGSIVNATGLVSSITDSTNTVYLGQIAPGTYDSLYYHYYCIIIIGYEQELTFFIFVGIQTFNGLMQDVYYYSQALTERFGFFA